MPFGRSNGILEILVVLVIILILFGPGRIAKTAKELGRSISAFREGLSARDDGASEPDSANNAADDGKTDER